MKDNIIALLVAITSTMFGFYINYSKSSNMYSSFFDAHNMVDWLVELATLLILSLGIWVVIKIFSDKTEFQLVLKTCSILYFFYLVTL